LLNGGIRKNPGVAQQLTLLLDNMQTVPVIQDPEKTFQYHMPCAGIM